LNWYLALPFDLEFFIGIIMYHISIGDKNNCLTVTSKPFYKENKKDRYIICSCQCGKILTVSISNFYKQFSCGCMTKKLINKANRKGTLAKDGIKKCAK
jgi:hypothetical protein